MGWPGPARGRVRRQPAALQVSWMTCDRNITCHRRMATGRGDLLADRRVEAELAEVSAALAQLTDLVELAGGDVKDEPADRILVRDKRAGLDPPYRLPNVLVDVGKGLGGPGRLDSGLVLDGALELIVGEGQHAAVGVVDQHDLARP